MQRTEGLGYVVDSEGRKLFDKGPPGTRVRAEWLNAVQEEIAGVIEGAGMSLRQAIDDSRTQLYEALQLIAQTLSIPTGTKMLIHADVAPFGWTLQSDLDDYTAMVTKGSVAGGNPGGAPHPTGVWQQDDYTLLVADVPSHDHVCKLVYFRYTSGDAEPGPQTVPLAQTLQSTGGGGAHNHGDSWRFASRCFIVCAKSLP